MKNIHSLKKNKEFQEVYQHRRSYANKALVIYVKENGLPYSRIGISVSKKIGNSVVRHRVTRVIRECWRLRSGEIKEGLDIIVIAREMAKEQGLLEMERSFFHIAEKMRITKSPKRAREN